MILIGTGTDTQAGIQLLAQGLQGKGARLGMS
jgi:hypothetical protein